MSIRRPLRYVPQRHIAEAHVVRVFPSPPTPPPPPNDCKCAIGAHYCVRLCQVEYKNVSCRVLLGRTPMDPLWSWRPTFARAVMTSVTVREWEREREDNDGIALTLLCGPFCGHFPSILLLNIPMVLCFRIVFRVWLPILYIIR